MYWLCTHLCTMLEGTDKRLSTPTAPTIPVQAPIVKLHNRFWLPLGPCFWQKNTDKSQGFLLHCYICWVQHAGAVLTHHDDCLSLLCSRGRFQIGWRHFTEKNLALGQSAEQSVWLFKAVMNHLVNIYSTFLKAQLLDQNVPCSFCILVHLLKWIKSPLAPLHDET